MRGDLAAALLLVTAGLWILAQVFRGGLLTRIGL